MTEAVEKDFYNAYTTTIYKLPLRPLTLGWTTRFGEETRQL
ncbi:hypothetical protein [Nostoc sp. WHI]|nr:hypothetical protein [Nostoc sp. WHI]